MVYLDEKSRGRDKERCVVLLSPWVWNVIEVRKESRSGEIKISDVRMDLCVCTSDKAGLT